MLKTRILTALVLGPAILAVVLFAPDWLFRLAAAALLLTGCWEFRRLANLSTISGGILFVLQLVVIGLMHYHWDVFNLQASIILMGSCVAWCLMYLQLYTYQEGQDTGAGYQARGFASALVAISACWFALSWLRDQTDGQFLILLLLFIIWAADVGAYFSGQWLGRTSLAPKISPKKTWEGVMGGILLSTLITLGLSRYTPLAGSPVLLLLLLTAVTVMSSIGGDLFISIHKRSVKLKDAGKLFPGHGGVLDRFDSLLPGLRFLCPRRMDIGQMTLAVGQKCEAGRDFDTVTILGSTGSVGESTLDVISRNPGRYRVAALTANRNTARLAEQCAEFGASLAVIADPGRENELYAALKKAGSKAEVMSGEAGMAAAAGLDEVDSVMASIVGAAGLKPTLRAAQTGKKVLLANKESLVIAGEVFVRAARENGARVLPVDSEHNAIFQTLPPGFENGLESVGVERIILTASGGPFLEKSASELSQVTPAQACNHPNWDMGRKISVDSATLMNKGLEVIEAHWLFDTTPDELEVLIHPQSIIHSMVAYRDGSVLAQLGTPDMRTPIAHALAWPDRIEAGVKRLNLAEVGSLHFSAPDFERFTCLGLAFQAMRAGQNAPVVLNAANEIAVQAFLDEQISFDRIPVLVDRVLQRTESHAISSLDDVLEQDRRARGTAHKIMKEMI